MTIETIQETSTVVKHMPLWHVILLNTDHHTVEWVITLIMTIFNKNYDEAYALTLQIHEKGQCIAATTHKEKAEMYQELVHGHGADPNSNGPQEPLPCVIEPVE
jgi:ATP-dependent Clp protease adaptor protein ClpS